LAAAKGKRELCQLIMENVVEKNPESTQNEPLYGMTPLHFAARDGHFSVCELIVQNVENKNPFDTLMRTPLYMAARQGHLSICRLLYKNAHNIDANELCMMLEEAVQGGHYDVCKFFVLEIGTKIPKISYSFFIEIILHIAAAKENLEVCKLITENLQINPISEHSYETPLHTAAKNGHFEIYKSIMKGFKDKNPKDAEGYTPLHYAAAIGHFDLCELIVKNVKNENPRNMGNETPMYLATINGHLQVCALFFKRSLRYKTFYEKSTLLYALKSGYISCSVLTDLAISPKKHKSVELSHNDYYSDISD
jgi:ankyrin repeat protein